mmetsp:Transcript_167734/g.533336  ORF Transcript_167734/g.533336 Transcript_167734/m.533336 type:complete len:384 (+) Transcript_167734:84-1235(+)
MAPSFRTFWPHSMRLLLLAALLATASGVDADHCTGGVMMEDASTCTESEVETAEEQLFASMSMELLQRDLRHTKVGVLPAEQLALEQRENSSLIAEDELIVGKENRTAVDEGSMAAQQRQNSSLIAEEDMLVGKENRTAVDEGSKTRDTEEEEEEEVGEEAEDEVQEPTVNCSEYPVFCDSKLNCSGNPMTASDRAAWEKQLATPDGHANLRSWCMVYPMYATSVSKCIVEDSKLEYAQAMYKDQSKAQLTEADAVYCFVAGHCNNTEVTVNTTLQEAEGICSERYGDRWKGVGWADFMGVVARAREEMSSTKQAWSEGRASWSELVALARQEAEISAMAACAMGNYQCDVFYCQASSKREKVHGLVEHLRAQLAHERYRSGH